MGIFLLLTCIGIAVVSTVWERNIYNPATLFFSFWAFVIFMSMLHLYDLYPISERAYLVLFVGLVAFYAGFLLVRLIKPVKRPTHAHFDISCRYEFNYRALYVVYAVLIAYLGFSAAQVLMTILNGGSLYDVRRMYFQDASSVFSFVQTYFVDIFIYIFLVISMVNFFTGKHKWVLMLLTLAVIGLYALQNGGRLIIYRFAIDVALTCFLFVSINETYSRKVRKAGFVFAGIFIAGIAGMVILSALRNTSVKSFYIYFTGCINLFDNRMAAIDTAAQSTNGFTMLGGLMRPFFILLDNLGLMGYPQSYLNAYAILREHVEPYYRIGSNVMYNAYVTQFLYFYLDFRIPGVILGSALYGGICSMAYKSLMKRPDIRNIAIYLLLAQELFTTMIRWQLTVPSYILALLLLLGRRGVFLRTPDGNRT